jgi:hypothetical protein
VRGKSLVRVALALVLVGCSQAAPSAANTPAPSPSPRTTLTAAEQTQLTSLEARPLVIPAKPAGTCPEGPFTPAIKPYLNGREETNVYGVGPVYGVGGPETASDTNLYYDVAYVADPTVKGVILVRIRELSGAYKGVFVGPYQTGSVVGTDTIGGVSTTLYDELALPIASPSTNTSAAPGWAIFKVRQGIDKRYTCVGIQIDTAAGTEVVVAAH